ncbi:MAG: spermine synthase [Anaerolineales bacterium]|nr:spermine synthase [Anaerolineae bacterium]PWB53586.1 MAG: spermine synthase [Anaerolineales bacterium]
MMVVLSFYQAKMALDAKAEGATHVNVSLDLGISTIELPINEKGLQLPQDDILSWDQLNIIAGSESSCFFIEDSHAQPIQFYSEETERVYSLYPTSGAPTMLVSGIPMHRIKGTDPHRDTLEKIRAIKPLVGQVLDTATGLGYTAIEAARTAEHVTTIELDPAALEVCLRNPWSQILFNNPKITQLMGDSFDVVSTFPDASFTRVIHDPPVFSLAGDLYSGEFYHELYRVMRNRSQLFHYVGDPESKSGRNITAGVMRRLEQVGFRQVRRAPRAFGVVAVK